MKRAGEPVEVATAYLFLASQDASYITGRLFTSMAARLLTDSMFIYPESPVGIHAYNDVRCHPIYNEIDKDFAAQAIPHHQSTVDIAKVYLRYGTDSKSQKATQRYRNRTNQLNRLAENMTYKKKVKLLMVFSEQIYCQA